MANQIPNDLIPADLVPAEQAAPSDLTSANQVPSDLIPAEQAAPERTPQQAPDYAQAAKYGFAHTITGLAGQAINKLSESSPQLAADLKNPLTGVPQLVDFLKPKDGYVPQTAGEKAVSIGTGFLDPLGFGVAGAAGQAVQKLPILKGLFQTTADLAAAKVSAQAAVELGQKLMEGEVRNTARSYLFNRLATDAAKGGAELGAYAGTQEAATQASQGDFNPRLIATKSLINGGLGALLGPAFGTLGRKVFGDEALNLAQLQTRTPIPEAADTAITDELNKRLTGVNVALEATPQSPELLAQRETLVNEKNQILNDTRGLLAQNVSPKQTLSADVTRQDFLDNVYNKAKEATDRLVNKGVIKPEDQAGWVSSLFSQIADKKGVPSYTPGFVEANLKLLLNQTERWHLADQRLGTRVSEAVNGLNVAEVQKGNLKQQLLMDLSKPILSLEKKGLSDQAAIRLLEYVESDPQGNIVFNPTPNQFRPAYQGLNPELVLSQYPELAQIRQAFDQAKNLSPSFAQEVGYVPGYVPRYQQPTGIPGGKTVRSYEAPGFTQEREAGFFNPDAHVTDLKQIAARYADQASRFIAYEKTLPQVSHEYAKLLALDPKSAEEFSKYAVDSLGLNSKGELAKQLGDKLAQGSEPLLRQMLQNVPNQDALVKDALKVINSSTYNALVFGRLKSQVLQALQPSLIGTAEIGPRWVARGYQAMLSKSERQFASKFDNLLSTADPAVLGEIGINQISRPGLKAVDSLLTLPFSPVRKVYSALESTNRRQMFLGAYHQAKDAFKRAAGDELLGGLLEGEKSAVRSALKRGGEEAAAQMYGLIRSYRTNFAYTLANKPQILRNELGRLIPFTTWGFQNFSRLATQPGQWSKQVGTTLAGLALVQMLTGYDFGSSANPIGDLFNIFSATPAPALTEPAIEAGKDFTQGKSLALAGRQFLNYTPVGAYTNFKKRLDESGDLFEALTGAKKIETNSLVERGVPKAFRSILYK